MVLVVLPERRQMFEPLVDVFDQSALVIVHVDARSNMHRRYQHHSFAHTALADDLLHLRSDVNVRAMRLRMKFQVFRQGFHGGILAELSTVSARRSSRTKP